VKTWIEAMAISWWLRSLPVMDGPFREAETKTPGGPGACDAL
jgi:hypothetical protein